jgi:predicted  nucleic acid-binding Zn-ribbon protein
MSLLAKIFIVMQTVLIMVYLGMTATLYQHRRDWRTSYQKLKHRYTTSVSRAQKEIQALRTYVQSKDELITSKQREVVSLKSSLDQQVALAQRNNQLYQDKTTEFNQLNQNFTNLSRNLSDANTRNKQLDDRKAELEGLLEVATNRRETAEGQVARLTTLNTNLEQDLGDLRTQFADTRQKLREKELLISMVEGSGVDIELLVPGPPVPAIDGNVVAIKTDVNPPLVLLSVGQDDRVERGFHFSIYRGSKFVGKVVVERVLRDSAGCRVLFTADGQQIQPGDNAATRLQ